MKPVAIVGAAALSSHGASWRGLGAALLAGTLAPGTIADADDSRAIARSKKMMSRGAYLAARCLAALVRDASWPRATAGYFLGVGASGGSLDDVVALLDESIADHRFSLPAFGDRGLAACNPLLAFQLMNNFTLCHGAILEGIGGPNAALFSRGAGTTAALIEAIHAIAAGDCTHAIAGGADSALHPVTRAELARDRVVERGLVPGEGAALLALGDGPPLAYVERASIVNGQGRELPALLRELDLSTDVDVTIAATSAELPGVPAVVLGLGDALAATQALAWVAALDLIVAGRARRVRVIGLGTDGDLACVELGTGSTCATFDPQPSGIVPASGTGSTSATSAAERPASDRATRAASSEDAPDADAHGADTPVMRAAIRRGRVGVSAGGARVDSVPVITGIGVVSAFGIGTAALFNALAEGKSGISRIRSFDASTFPTRVAGEVPVHAIDAAWLVERGIASGLAERLAASGALRDRKIGFALAAAQEAWTRAGCGDGARRASLVLALGLEQAFLEDFGPIFERGRGIDWDRERTAPLPAIRFRSPVDLALRAVTEQLGVRGPRVANASACAAGALAVAHAASLIARGDADLVVCGAADSMVNPLGLGGMCRLGAPSPRDDLDACRPFDRARDGLVIGEGAAVFVLESEAHANARGARPIARVVGWGSTQDAYRVTAPRPDGAAACRAMQRAIARAGLAAEAIGYVNAHGTGTPLNDPAECKAIHGALGAHADRVAVSSIKGAVGHLMAASGAIEIAASLLAFERDLLPGTAHHRERDPECNVDVIGPEPRRARVEHVLSNSFGFGGQNASVILGRCA